MSVVAVVGDATTTTTLALAATWPDEALVVEADPTGGSVAAWLDLPASPTLSTVVTRAPAAGWPAVEQLAHDAPSGVRVVPAPVRTVEATRAVAEAERGVLPLAAELDRPVVLADLGARVAAHGPPSALSSSDVAVVVHRQCRSSARAAAVRLERAAELVDAVAATGVALVVAVIGRTPFEPDEIGRFLATDSGGRPEPPGAGPGATLVELPDDPLSAAVLAGRSGVSARRLARLPLLRDARRVAVTIAARLEAERAVAPIRPNPHDRPDRPHRPDRPAGAVR